MAARQVLISSVLIWAQRSFSLGWQSFIVLTVQIWNGCLLLIDIFAWIDCVLWLQVKNFLYKKFLHFPVPFNQKNLAQMLLKRHTVKLFCNTWCWSYPFALSASLRHLTQGAKLQNSHWRLTELTQTISCWKQAVWPNTIYMEANQDLCTRILCLTTLLIQLSMKARKKIKM